MSVRFRGPQLDGRAPGCRPARCSCLGFIGYACFAGGNLLELFGVAGAALVAAVPGGLFELTFAVWLIARGFASTANVARARAPD